MRHLIVNGDDFGLTAGVNRGILEAHHRGVLTSTSLMVNRPAAVGAVALARHAPDLSIGLHLELDGPAEGDARAAVDQQLARFEDLVGRPPTHLDSHHDAHRDPRALPHVLDRAGRLGVPVRGHSPVACWGQFYGAWGGESHPEQVSVGSLLRMLETGRWGDVTELICHPGYVDADLRSSYREVREAEIATLCDPRIRVALDRCGLRLIGFRELPERLSGAAGSRAAS